MSISYFSILVDKVFSKSEILLEVTDHEVHYPEELKRHIEEVWRIAQNRGRVFTGPMSRLFGFKLINSKLKLILGSTNYKEFVGTRTGEIFQKYGAKYLANPLAICSVISTTDKVILISKRSGVESRPGFYHVVGGYLDPYRHCDSKGLPDPFKAITTEILEETGIKEHNIKDIICLGLVYDTVLFHPELTFYTEVTLSFPEIIRLCQLEKETEKMECIPDAPQPIIDFVMLHHKEMAPTGLANIILYLKYKHRKIITELNLPHVCESDPTKHLLETT